VIKALTLVNLSRLKSHNLTCVTQVLDPEADLRNTVS